MKRFLQYKVHSSSADTNNRDAALPIEEIASIKDAGGGIVKIETKKGGTILANGTVSHYVAQINV